LQLGSTVLVNLAVTSPRVSVVGVSAGLDLIQNKGHATGERIDALTLLVGENARPRTEAKLGAVWPRCQPEPEQGTLQPGWGGAQVGFLLVAAPDRKLPRFAGPGAAGVAGEASSDGGGGAAQEVEVRGSEAVGLSNGSAVKVGALNPQPSTLNPHPTIFETQPPIHEPQPSNLNPKSPIRNPQPSMFNPYA